MILAHYYQDPEIQDLADFVGDSLQLSQAAASTDAQVIAFCGVHFMAETAKILNPAKRVVIPDLDAGCSLADRCPADAFAAWLKDYPDHVVVSYINCSAGVKALSDIICTSSNAERVVRSIPAGPEDRVRPGPPPGPLGDVPDRPGHGALARASASSTSSSPPGGWPSSRPPTRRPRSSSTRNAT